MHDGFRDIGVRNGGSFGSDAFRMFDSKIGIKSSMTNPNQLHFILLADSKPAKYETI